MTRAADIDRLVTEWLAAEASAAGSERILAGALTRVAGVGQQRSRGWSPLEGIREGARLVRATIGGRRLAAAAGAAIVLVLIGSALGVGPSVPTMTAPPAGPLPSFGGPEPVMPLPLDGPIVAGRYRVDWAADMRITLRVPDGWWSTTYGSSISRHPRDVSAPSLTISAHQVQAVAISLCGDGSPLVDIGGSPSGLRSALGLRSMAGIEGPTAITLGGYPATHYVLSVPTSCAGPAPGLVWRDVDGRELLVPPGGTASIDVVEVFGRAVAFAIVDAGSPAADLDQARSIVASASIEIEPPGFHITPPPHWEGPKDGVYVSRSVTGPQGAEAIVAWTMLPDAATTEPCPEVLGDAVAGTTDELAAAMAAAPGTEIVTSPEEATVAGRPAKHLAVVVRTDQGCGPGYFVTWGLHDGGAFWPGITVGDTIDVWLIDLGGRHLLIEAIVSDGFGRYVDDDIKAIVDSIQLE